MDTAEDIINALMEFHHIPGLSLAIVKDGEAVATKGFGCEDLQSGSPVTGRTRFGLGSLTKSFTSALLASLLQNRRNINWDTPLEQVFRQHGQDFKLGDDFRTSRACLRDILAHKMGVELGENDFAWMFQPFTKTHIFEQISSLPYAADFRTKMIYNNLMYVLAGKVAEMLGGESWEHLIRTTFLDVLGMVDSGFLDNELPQGPNIAKPHMAVKGKPVPIDPEIHRSSHIIGPAGSMCASAEDMAKWMKFHLSQGEVDGVQLIKPKFLKECHLPQFALPLGKPEWSGYICRPSFPATETRDAYGFGWYTGTYREFRTVCHTGELFGYDAQITLFPEANIGIYTNINGPAGEPAFTSNQLIHYALSDAMLGLTSWLTPETACSFPEPWKSRQPYFPTKINSKINKSIPPSRPPSMYTGTYQHDFLGNIQIYLEDETLCFSFGKHGRFKLFPDGIGPDEFRMEGQGIVAFLHVVDVNAPSDWMTVNFSSKSGGEITELYCSLFESGPCFVKQ